MLDLVRKICAVIDAASWWDRRAERLQSSVRMSEREKIERYDDGAVNKAIVYSREDIVAIVSLLSSANKQLSAIKLLIIMIGVVFVFVHFKYATTASGGPQIGYDRLPCQLFTNGSPTPDIRDLVLVAPSTQQGR